MLLGKQLGIFAVAGILLLGTTACVAANAQKNDVLDESWEAILWNDAHMGYVHTLVQAENAPEPIIVTSVFEETHLKRIGADMVIRAQVEYKEKPGGEIVSVVSRTLMSGSEKVSTCTRQGDQMRIVTTTADSTHEETIPWDNNILGPWEQTLLMRKLELKPGVSTTFKVFSPEFLRPISSTITVGEKERITVNGEETELFSGTLIQDILPTVITRVWMDDNADVIRSRMEIMDGIEMIRTTREEAMKSVVPEQIRDVMMRFAVQSNVRLENPRAIREALYRIKGDNTILAALDLIDRRQTIEKEMEGAILLRVRALPDADEPAANKPGEEYLASSPYIQCTDEAIVKRASKIVEGATTPQEKAKRLEAWVYKNIKKKNYNVGFASAKEVFTSREGDCTEHSVLLAAMLRAVGIPARVSVGLVYWEGIFAYHMWTEAFLNDWTALDATLNGEVVDATHIKFAADPLDKPAAAGPFTELVPVIGKVGVTPLETKE